MKYFCYPVLLLLLFFELSKSQTDVISLQERVTDLSGILSIQDKNQLSDKLENFYNKNSIDFLIVIVKSLNGEEVRDYGIKLLEKNKAGAKEKDNGLLLLVAIEDRKIAIEVGYGLEGDLTDAQSDYIIRNVITPFFKSGNYFNGINEAVNTIISHFSGEVINTNTLTKNKVPNWLTLIAVLVFIIFSNGFLNRPSHIGSHRSRRGMYLGGFGGGFGGSSRSWSGGGGGFGGGGASGSW
ncbi:MAG: TPM domain-containing protein [Bacteroidetes bacterium]|nr:TPM domain-containing protein [Bacteroidota bacterium]